jgi:hypothetical protein
MLKIHEITTDAGSVRGVFLDESDGVLAIVGDDGIFALPEGALDAVMARFGAPLDSDSDVVAVAAMNLTGGRALRHVRHLAKYDVIARDYLVYEVAGSEPLCALATSAAGALDHLARASLVRRFVE